jgi:hypothetical protein
MTDKLKPCPFCGGEIGYMSRHTITQFYNLAGEPDGYEYDNVTTGKVKCVKCKKIISLKRIQEMNRKRRERKTSSDNH